MADAQPDLPAIRQRVDAAAEGPWAVAEDADLALCIVTQADDRWDNLVVEHHAVERHDAEFIAHARTDIPALLAEVESQRAEIEQLTDDLGGVDASFAAEIEESDRLTATVSAQSRALAAAEAALADLRKRITDLADEWQEIYDRWIPVNDGPRVAIFRVHARKVRALLDPPTDTTREVE